MIALNQSNALLSQLTQGSSLIGRSVNWEDPYTVILSSAGKTSFANRQISQSASVGMAIVFPAGRNRV